MNIIISGPKAFFCSNRKHKLQRWEMHFVSVTPVQYLRWSEMPITFSREDHWVRIPDPGSYQLVVCPTIDRVLIFKVLIDGGSGLNIIFTETLKPPSLRRPVLPRSARQMILSYWESRLAGDVRNHNNYRIEHLTFEVANFKTSYHAIFGRPMLVRFMVIPNHTYLVLKMPAPNGVLSIFGDVEMSYKAISHLCTLG